MAALACCADSSVAAGWIGWARVAMGVHFLLDIVGGLTK